MDLLGTEQHMSVGRRALVGGVASLAVVGTAVGWYAGTAPQEAASGLQVDDTAQVLHEPSLREALDDIRFHQPTDVAVYTTRGGQEALTDDRALNDAVLSHARAERPEWLSADGQTWADDLFVFAVDPEGRLVGTYFGENRAVDQEEQTEIQEATYDELRAGRWTDGAVTGIEEAAARMNSPFVRTAGGTALAGVASGVTVLGAGAFLGVGLHRVRRSRAARAEGDERMAAVVRDHELTELHARLIPDSSRYGGLMLRRYDEYRQAFRELTELGNEVRAIPERDYDTSRALARLTAYRDRARSLDELDDVIADTAALLCRDSGWAEAWHRQVAPVREELEQVEPLLSSDLPDEVRDLPEAGRLRRFASAELAGLDRLRGELESRTVTPDDALDRLRDVRDRMGEHLDALAAAAARTMEEDSERETMLTAMRTERDRRHREPTIIATADPVWTWYALSSFRTGWDNGTSEVQQARSSASGGSTSGYSGGGSFSGAGSSSRF